MPTTESRTRPGLIVSTYRYEKDGRLYYAALDASTASVRVLARSAVRQHNLREHFARTTTSSQDQIATLVDAALSRVDGLQDPAGGTRTFTFMPTSHCNMGCNYCGQIHSPGNVSPAVSSSFVDRVQAAFVAPDVDHIHVAWFGGEPLLAYRSIIEMSLSFVEMARVSKRSYTSKMTTNGALLTSSRMKELIETAQVSRFDITLDGPPDVHNRHRALKAGGASFDKIVRTLEWFRDASISQRAVVVLRTNVDKENLNYIGDYLRLMKALGFSDEKRFLFEISPIHSWGNDISAVSLTTQDAARHEIEWMELMERLGLPYGLLPGRPRTRTCVATDPLSEVIDSRGTQFSCTETPLTPQAGSDTLGNILSNPTFGRRPPGRFDGWDQAVDAGGLPCSSCDLRAVCRGACPKQWTEGSVPCPTLKLNFDDRLAIFMRRHGYRVANVE